MAGGKEDHWGRTKAKIVGPVARKPRFEPRRSTEPEHIQALTSAEPHVNRRLDRSHATSEIKPVGSAIALRSLVERLRFAASLFVACARRGSGGEPL